MPPQAVKTLLSDPTNLNTLYAGLNGAGVFKTTNGGAQWSPSNNGLTNSNILSLAAGAGLLCVGTTGGGVFLSTDGAVSWQATTSPGGFNIAALTVAPSTPPTIYAGGTGGVFMSTNSGASWNPANNGLTNQLVQALAVDPQAPSTIYAGTNGGALFNTPSNPGGIFKSLSGGTWAPNGNTFYGGAYKTTSTIGSSVLVGCYSESDQVNGSELMHPTLVLGGQLAGGFGSITTAGILDKDGIRGELPVRTPIIKKMRVLRATPGVSVLNIGGDDQIIFTDGAGGTLVIILPLPTLYTGREFIIKRVDSTSNTNTITLQVIAGLPIDGDTNPINLFPNFSGLTVVADQTDYKIIGRF